MDLRNAFGDSSSEDEDGAGSVANGQRRGNNSEVMKSTPGRKAPKVKLTLEALRDMDDEIHRARPARKRRRSKSTRNVSISDIDPRATEDEIKSHFEQFGAVEGVKIFRPAGRPSIGTTNRAFVLFRKKKDAENLVNISKTTFQGRTVLLDLSQMPKGYCDKEGSYDSDNSLKESYRSDQNESYHSLLRREREELGNLLISANMSRRSVLDGMLFCMEKAEYAGECSQILVDSILDEKSGKLTGPQAIARLYVISDVLHNASAVVRNASAYRASLEPNMSRIFESLMKLRKSCGFIAGKAMDWRVSDVVKSWRNKLVFNSDYLIGLEGVYSGVFHFQEQKEKLLSSFSAEQVSQWEDQVLNFAGRELLQRRCIQNGLLWKDADEKSLRSNLVIHMALIASKNMIQKSGLVSLAGAKDRSVSKEPNASSTSTDIDFESIDGEPLQSSDEIEDLSSIDGYSLTEEEISTLGVHTTVP